MQLFLLKGAIHELPLHIYQLQAITPNVSIIMINAMNGTHLGAIHESPARILANKTVFLVIRPFLYFKKKSNLTLT